MASVAPAELDEQELLAHYTDASAAFTKILAKQEIRLSPLAWMPDPHESAEWEMWYRGVGRLDDEDDDQLRPGLWPAPPPLNRCLKILSTTRDRLGREDDNPFKVESLRCWSHPRLWDRYADRYRGVCLLFDKAALGATIKDFARSMVWFYEGEVTYGPLLHMSYPPVAWHIRHYGPDWPHEDKDQSVVRLLGAAVAGGPEQGPEEPDVTGIAADWLLLRKMKDWESEQEYRYILFDWTEDYVRVPIASSLKGVVLGSDFPDWQVAGAKAACDALDLAVYHGRWDGAGLGLTRMAT